MKKITDYLQELGLTEIEAALYEGLLETGSTTVMELAEHTGIKRITTHFNIENLIKKGLVTQIIVGARRQIMAEGPEKLEYLITQKEREVRRIRDEFSIITKDLSSSLLHSQAGEHVQVKYYEGKEAVQSVYKEILKANVIYAFANFDRLLSVFPENHELFQKTLNQNPKMEIWDIFETTIDSQKLASKTNKRHHFCFFPPNMSLSDFDFLIFDNNVAMIYLNQEKPYAIVSHSYAMAAGLKAIHSIVWKVLSEKGY